MLCFVPVKSLAYTVTKITVHIPVLKYWERKSRGNTEECRNFETSDGGQFPVACVCGVEGSVRYKRLFMPL